MIKINKVDVVFAHFGKGFLFRPFSLCVKDWGMGLLFLLVGVNVFAQNLSITNARVEYKVNPIGIDIMNPKFSWELQSKQQNVLQTALQILVSDDSILLTKNIGTVWDSKKLSTNASVQVEYKGKILESAKKYYWKVKVWDNKSNESNWSNIENWQMGLLNNNAWNNAKWIAYDEINDTAIIAPHMHLNGKKTWGTRRNILPMFRKTFSVTKSIKSATSFICGLGQFDFFINGKKVGDHFLDPGWTNYTKEAQYVSFDITNNLQKGANTFGVMLGNGFFYIPGQRYRKMTGAYGLPKMIMRTLVEYTDGSLENIITDESWKTAPSPIIFSSIFGGEDYDANMEQLGWNQNNFNDAYWKNAIIVKPIPHLIAMVQEPNKVMQKFEAKTLNKLNDTTIVYDFGQNFSGIPFVKVNGNLGDTVRLYCAELINEDGTANQRATGSPSYFTYIIGATGQASWQPQFSYTGFRYVQVKCIPRDSGNALPQVLNIQGWHISNAMKSVGKFESSNTLFNETNHLIQWAIKSNSMSLFTDCPHREKLGWLEQTYLMGTSVQYNYDIANLCKKMIFDMMSSQYENGKVAEIAPEFTSFTAPFDDSPEWGSAAIILPWYNYKWYADKQTLQDAYPMMKKYISYLQSKKKDNILCYGLGDWFDIGPAKSGFAQMTKMGITATATYYYDLGIMQKVATLLNNKDDANNYSQQAVLIKKAFNKNFFDTQKLQYDSASQTANAMALYVDVVEPQYKDAVINALAYDIKSRNNALTAGDIGYRYVIKALENAGRSDVIFDMNSKDDVPGYGFQLKHGATALTESWQAYPNVSNNHFMLGHLMEWFYSGLVGLKQAENSIGYKNIEIKPQIVGDIKNAKASFISPYGLIKVAWKKGENNLDIDIEIPANTNATIYIPANNKNIIKQNNKIISANFKNGNYIVNVGSGKYNFTIKIN